MSSSCSGKDDCPCDACNYSSSEDESSGRPKILKHLPAGAIPINQYHRPYNRNVSYAPSYSSERPITISVPVFPLNNLVGLDSGLEGKISISILNRNGMITFSWESFRGQLGSRGITGLSLSTDLPYLPVYPTTIPIRLEYNGIGQMGYLIINPKEAIEKVKFYFNVTSQGSSLYGDIIHINGSSVSYISHSC